jgi:S1-C subfamily serine protease
MLGAIHPQFVTKPPCSLFGILLSMNKYLFRKTSALFIFSAVLFSFPLSSVRAETSTSAIESATVNLYCKVKIGGREYSSTGSGVFIHSQGVILTNAHVGQYFLLTSGSKKKKAQCTVRTGSPSSAVYTADLLYISPSWFSSYRDAVADKEQAKGTGEGDFSLLYVTGQKNKRPLPVVFPALALATAQTVLGVTQGTAVTIAGYPAEGFDFKEIRKGLPRHIASSSVTSVRSFVRPFADVLALAPSTAGKSGISGGPVVNASQTVLGIATSVGSEDKKNGLRVLRAISVVHMDRVVRIDTGLSLLEVASGSLMTRSTLTLAALPSDVRKLLETTLRRVR